MSINIGPIVKGVVVDFEYDAVLVEILPSTKESANRLPIRVKITSGYHRMPYVDDRGDYDGIEFGQLTPTRFPVKGDMILLRRNINYPHMAWAWCYEEETSVAEETLPAEIPPQFANLRGYKRRLAKRGLLFPKKV